MTKAKILIFGEAYELLEWETQYYQYTTKDGFPTRKVLGGEVVVSLESSADKDRFLWEMLRDSKDKTWNEVDKMFDFQLHFFKDSYDEPPTKILNYRDGIMVRYREIFCAEGETPMFFKIHITAALHEIGMGLLLRRWHHSKPTATTETNTPIRQQEQEGEMSELYWTDLEGNKVDRFKNNKYYYANLRSTHKVGDEVSIVLSETTTYQFFYKGNKLENNTIENHQIRKNEEKLKVQVKTLNRNKS